MCSLPCHLQKSNVITELGVWVPSELSVRVCISVYIDLFCVCLSQRCQRWPWWGTPRHEQCCLVNQTQTKPVKDHVSSIFRQVLMFSYQITAYNTFLFWARKLNSLYLSHHLCLVCLCFRSVHGDLRPLFSVGVLDLCMPISGHCFLLVSSKILITLPF